MIGRFLAGLMLALAGLPGHAVASQDDADPIQFVDPLIGTGGAGHVFPGATTPFGMVQLSPSNDERGWKWTSGYHHDDTVIKGFAHTHISGAGLSALGDILLMPARTADTRIASYRSRFSHANEQARPGYYRVHLDDPDVDAELTATPRTGVHRYSYGGGGGNRFLIVDPTHGILDFTTETQVRIVSDREIRGFKRAFSQSAGTRSVYFVARFSQPFVKAGLTDADTPVSGRQRTGKRIKAHVRFADAGARAVEVAVAISHVSEQGALANFAAEAQGRDFDTVRESAQAAWRDRLSRITIDEPSLAKKRIFYTAAYHAAIAPNLISDVTGDYYVEGKVRRSAIAQFSNFSTWDTYRALHPLLTIIDPAQNGRMVASMVSRHSEAGLLLPSWEAVGHDNRVMIGYSIVSPIADAVLKHAPGVDPAAAYAAIRASAFDRTKHSNVYDANGMDAYLTYGFVAADVASSVSKTTEQNYEDWAIGRVAARLGREGDARLFARRSQGWRSLFDAASGDLLPRFADGRFAAMRRDRWSDLNQHYVSGNIWAYAAYTPHDMIAAIRLHGGRAAYARWLEGIFTDQSPIEGEQHVDLSGFIGRYGHGDEPGHHMAYLFDQAGRPWLTQKHVNRIVREMYSDKPDGLVNNEDLGQMSAWYIFSTLGFYPVTPGDLTYQIGAPYHRRAVLKVGEGRRFTVEAENLSDENIYVQSATLDGAPLDRSFVTHDEIMRGGSLRFVMGPRPNTAWASAPGASSLGDFDDRAPVEMVRDAPWAPYDPEARAGFAQSRAVTLRAEDAAAIHYTLDGSAPTARSPRFAQPIRIDGDTLLRAVAIAHDGTASTVFEKCYVRTILADLPASHPTIGIAERDMPYGRLDGALLIDQVFGTAHYPDRRWSGRQGDITATIDLGAPRAATSAMVGYLDDPMNGILPPRRIEVWAGDVTDRLTLIGGADIASGSDIRQEARTAHVALPGRAYRYYRVAVTGAGTMPLAISEPDIPAWLFLDEIVLR